MQVGHFWEVFWTEFCLTVKCLVLQNQEDGTLHSASVVQSPPLLVKIFLSVRFFCLIESSLFF